MVSFRSKKNRRTGKTTRFPVSDGRVSEILNEDVRRLHESTSRCEDVTVQPPISITVSSGGVSGMETPSREPQEQVVAPVVVKKSTEYPASSLTGKWDEIEPELYNKYGVVNVKKTLARGKATV